MCGVASIAIGIRTTYLWKVFSAIRGPNFATPAANGGLIPVQRDEEMTNLIWRKTEAFGETLEYVLSRLHLPALGLRYSYLKLSTLRRRHPIVK